MRWFKILRRLNSTGGTAPVPLAPSTTSSRVSSGTFVVPLASFTPNTSGGGQGPSTVPLGSTYSVPSTSGGGQRPSRTPIPLASSSTPNNAQSVERQIASIENNLDNHSNVVNTVRGNLSSIRRRVARIENQLRGRPHPGITEWQAWKEEACHALGINN